MIYYRTHADYIAHLAVTLATDSKRESQDIRQATQTEIIEALRLLAGAGIQVPSPAKKVEAENAAKLEAVRMARLEKILAKQKEYHDSLPSVVLANKREIEAALDMAKSRRKRG